MGFIIWLMLPFRVFLIFDGFTFTDLEDFMPLLTLIIGGICAAIISRFPQKKATFPLFCSMGLLCLWPLLPNLSLFFMAREHQAVHGNWPQVMIDDPKNAYGHVSPLFDTLFHLTNYVEAFSSAWMLVFLALFFAAKPRFSVQQKRCVLTLAAFSLFLVFCDFGNLYAWWLD